MIEHFTNSRCGICSFRNPTFYNLLNNYKGEYHHIAYHPSVPYSSCVFYQANPTENEARRNLYGVWGTPLAYVSGNLVSSGDIMPASTMNGLVGQTSPVRMEVEEINSGLARIINVKIRSTDMPPSGNWRLFVAFVEKEVNYNAPNGETLHHDVFRQMAPSIQGESISLPAVGDSLEKSYLIALDPSWNASEMYAVAFIQDNMTNEVLNSGTKYDILAELEATDVQCNEMGGINLTVSGGTAPYAFNWSNGATTEDLNDLVPGTYYVTITDAEGQSYEDSAMVSGNYIREDAFEMNDDASSASPLPLIGVHKNATVCPAGDEDWYAFEVGTKTHFQIQLSDLSNDLKLEAYSPQMLLLGSSDNSGTASEKLILNGLVTGSTYLIRVMGSSNDVVDDEGYQLVALRSYSPYGQISSKGDKNYALADLLDSFSRVDGQSNKVRTFFHLEEQTPIRLEVLDMKGQVVHSLDSNREYDKGQHSLSWSSRGLDAGIYYVVLYTRADRYTHKVVLLE